MPPSGQTQPSQGLDFNPPSPSVFTTSPVEQAQGGLALPVLGDTAIGDSQGPEPTILYIPGGYPCRLPTNLHEDLGGIWVQPRREQVTSESLSTHISSSVGSYSPQTRGRQESERQVAFTDAKLCFLFV